MGTTPARHAELGASGPISRPIPRSVAQLLSALYPYCVGVLCTDMTISKSVFELSPAGATSGIHPSASHPSASPFADREMPGADVALASASGMIESVGSQAASASFDVASVMFSSEEEMTALPWVV